MCAGGIQVEVADLPRTSRVSSVATCLPADRESRLPHPGLATRVSCRGVAVAMLAFPALTVGVARATAQRRGGAWAPCAMPSTARIRGPDPVDAVASGQPRIAGLRFEPASDRHDAAGAVRACARPGDARRRHRVARGARLRGMRRASNAKALASRHRPMASRSPPGDASSRVVCAVDGPRERSSRRRQGGRSARRRPGERRTGPR